MEIVGYFAQFKWRTAPVGGLAKHCRLLLWWPSKESKEYKLEKYLYTIKDTHTERSFTKFRISNHKLLIEYGRYQNIPSEERHCKLCETKKVEDEFHFALECQQYQNIRNNSHNILKKIFQMNIQNESKRNLMSNVMSTEFPVLIELFSTLIFKCFTLRDRSLQTGNANK